MTNYRGSINKYKNHRVETYEGTFDSKKEFLRWKQLRMMQAAGKIQNLQRQVAYTLVPAQQTSSGTERSVKYIADFVYEMDGKTIVEDTKGFKTPDYIIKRKLMLYIHGIEIQEV